TASAPGSRTCRRRTTRGSARWRAPWPWSGASRCARGSTSPSPDRISRPAPSTGCSALSGPTRSEERRVGKEWRSRWEAACSSRRRHTRSDRDWSSDVCSSDLDRLGPRFPDMSEAYDSGLRALARAVALERGITLREGVYVAVTGPNLETRAEYRMLRALGADVVGMSTVPEVITAVHMGMKVLGVSIITDQCLPDALAPTSVEQIIAVARAAEPGLTALVDGVLERLN